MTSFYRIVKRVMFLFAALSFGLVVCAYALPKKRALVQVRLKLEEARSREAQVLKVKEHKMIELNALKNDVAYLEVQSRDRLNYYQEGERVLRFDPDR